VRIGRKTQATVFLGDDHAEELVLLQELPHLRRQVGAHVGGLPVVDHLADFLDRAVEECLFFLGQFRRGLVEQHLPFRPTGKQLAFEADRAGLQRHLLGVRQRRQDLGIEGQKRRSDPALADRGEQQRQNDHRQQHRRHDRGDLARAQETAGHQGRSGDGREDCERPAVVGGDGRDQDQGKEGDQNAHLVDSGNKLRQDFTIRNSMELGLAVSIPMRMVYHVKSG
jgi:hypothetical protein